MPRLSKIGAAALAAFGWTSGSAVSASYLVVAGGGGGGKRIGAGGGAGGYRTGTASLNPTLSYTVTVGAGGAGSGVYSSIGSSGSDSVFNAITSTGGGGGDSSNASKGGGSGGSGGGSADGGTVGSGNTPSTSPSQGNNGGVGSGNSPNYGSGGGGGASAVGGNGSSTVAGNGGAGTASSISGSSVTYAGGGGGGSYGGTAGSGGAGGGGAGTTSDSTATAGTANLGGGGGGCGGISNSSGTTFGGQGGSGIVIISYLGAQQFSGGVVTSSGGNTIHTFTTSGTLGPVTPLSANYLVVAGGGGGGSYAYSGGGGAGGMQTGSALTIDPYSTYIVTVGAGGAGGVYGGTTDGVNGTNSAFSAYATASVGGGYGSNTGVGGNGGSGGGGRGNILSNTGGTATSGQGNAGGNGASDAATYANGGGGGGAGAVGANATSVAAGAGGIGATSSISGTSTYYAGGGGGGGTGTEGAGGNGGGGAANESGGTAGTANTGGGGGSAGGVSLTNGGNGGSGVVIISYAGSTQLMAGGVVTIAGGNVIHTFNSSGYLTPLTLLTRSLRFRSSASASLTRTPATASNRKTFTWSGWVKRGTLSTYQNVFGATTGGYPFLLRFDNDNTLFVYQDGAADYGGNTSAVYRDPSAWYHIVLAIDTTQATDTNRLKLYINGVQVSVNPTYGYFALNVDTSINSTGVHSIGGPSANYFDGYMAEVNFIDGQALAPTAFGTFNSYGVWQPITYGGSYGTNGFRLPFTNNASTTTLGYDFSPQGNNWTTNNISVTAGSTYDSMTDVPTLTSATAANFATWNPLWFIGSSTFSSGNLIASCPANNGVYTTMYVSTGKWYAEVTPSSSVGGIGVNASTGYIPVSGGSFGYNNGDYSYLYSGNKMVNNGTQSAYGSTWTTNDVIGIAIDADAGTVTMYKNNVSQGAIVTGLTGKMWVIAACSLTGTFNMTLNNGAGSGFTYTPPTGFLALNTFNL